MINQANSTLGPFDALSRSRDSVAVVMRTKNRPLLLPRALSSVLSQTHANWHLYLVNDGGDRQALETQLRGYLPVFGSKLTVFHHEASLGMENASNSALALAAAEFVVIHDDDDSWHPQFLEATTQYLIDDDQNTFAGVTTACEKVTEIICDNEVIHQSTIPWKQLSGPVLLRQMLIRNSFPPICLLYRRSALDQIGMYNGNLPVLGDWEFNIRLLQVGEIGFISRPLARYHLRPKNQSSVYNNTIIAGMDVHRHVKMQLDNAALRKTLSEAPQLYGVVQAILQDHAQSTQKILDRLQEIETKIDKLRWLKRGLRKLFTRLKIFFGKAKK
jgi:glycosyltransferase involved in cell wall biosynthesis